MGGIFCSLKKSHAVKKAGSQKRKRENKLLKCEKSLIYLDDRYWYNKCDE